MFFLGLKIVVRDQDRKALRDMAVVIGKNIDHIMD